MGNNTEISWKKVEIICLAALWVLIAGRIVALYYPEFTRFDVNFFTILIFMTACCIIPGCYIFAALFWTYIAKGAPSKDGCQPEKSPTEEEREWTRKLRTFLRWMSIGLPIIGISGLIYYEGEFVFIAIGLAGVFSFCIRYWPGALNIEN